ncbi:MAG TPA: hypothetical protein VIL20_07665 [Sandaracinaceae bacterium]
MLRPLVPVLIALACVAAAGCKVTREDIDYWTGTQKGPGKIVAVLLADKYEDDLRAYAGLALVRMEPRTATETQDAVDGVSELQAAVRQLPEETRTRLVDLMVPRLIEMMRGQDAPQASSGEEEGVPRRQVRAKDAAFLIIPYASPERRRELTEAVVDWFVVDFNGRSLEGNYTAEQVVRQLGAVAASRLVNALNARLPQQALVKLAELIASLGDAETKQRAAVRLVEIEREMEGEEFMNWLRERLREQLLQQMDESQRAQAQINQERIEAAAALNRENFINLGALPAMKHLNGERVVQDRLLEIARQQVGEEPISARRVVALRALEGGVRPDQVDALLDIALNDPTAKQAVRSLGGARPDDYAFDRISDARATSAIPRLWPVFDSTDDIRLRRRVGALILALGGPDVVQEFFNHLDDESYEQAELHNYGQHMSQMRPPPTEFVSTQLQSRQWFDRVIALYFWQHRATAADLPRITALEQDATPTAGSDWRDQNTVGKVAQAVAQAVRDRLERAQRDAQGGGSEGSGSSDGGGSQ